MYHGGTIVMNRDRHDALGKMLRAVDKDMRETAALTSCPEGERARTILWFRPRGCTGCYDRVTTPYEIHGREGAGFQMPALEPKWHRPSMIIPPSLPLRYCLS